MPEMSEMYRGKRAREKEAEGLKEASMVLRTAQREVMRTEGL